MSAPRSPRSAGRPSAPAPSGGRSERPRTGAGARLPRVTGLAEPGERTPKKKAGGGRRTRMKARINKKTGDVRNKPDVREDGTPKKKLGPITAADLRYLRGLGHHLDPVIQIGKEGISDAVVAALESALRTHELVKVRVGTESPVDRKAAGPELAARAGATLAQILGRTVLLYRRHPNKPKIELPRQ